MTTAPLVVGAANESQEFVPLVGIPFLDETDNATNENPGLAGYVNGLYRAAIIVAAILAVAKIVIAGVQYMLTDVAPTKGQAKKTIRGAIIGLLLVIGAVLILETINPTLTNLNALSRDQLQGIEGTQGQVAVSLPGNSIDELCEQAGGNRATNPCEVMPCDQGSESRLGRVWRDTVSCAGECTRLGGAYLDRNLFFGMRDSCVIPQNSELADKALCEERDGGTYENGVCRNFEINSGSTGDTNLDRASCERDFNGQYNESNGHCRAQGITYQELPASAEVHDQNAANYIELLNIECGAYDTPGNSWSFDQATGLCRD